MMAELLLGTAFLHACWLLLREHHRDRSAASRTTQLVDALLTREFLWAIGPGGRFTFSSPASLELLGYHPSELVGRPCSLVIDLNDLRAARAHPAAESALVLLARHKDGSRVLVEVSGGPGTGRTGRPSGFEGLGHRLDGQTERNLIAARARVRIDDVLATRTLVTAFQPIYSLETRTVIGAEALTRIVSSPVRPPETWFAEAASVGRGLDLEFLAMETALRAAGQLPENLYVAVNLSPEACLDPRLSDILVGCGLPAWRIVIELTERAAVTEYGPLLLALAELRQSGLRIAVDDAGAGFASMRHILQLKPDLIKLDRSIIAGIHEDRCKSALGAALVSFAEATSAKLVAEGVETQAELSAVAELGIDSAQGYFLGTPSVSTAEWLGWNSRSSLGPALGRQ
ncbi:MAG: EAL domain-containing protein [Arthrobacter sp.]